MEHKDGTKAALSMSNRSEWIEWIHFHIRMQKGQTAEYKEVKRNYIIYMSAEWKHEDAQHQGCLGFLSVCLGRGGKGGLVQEWVGKLFEMCSIISRVLYQWQVVWTCTNMLIVLTMKGKREIEALDPRSANVVTVFELNTLSFCVCLSIPARIYKTDK